MSDLPDQIKTLARENPAEEFLSYNHRLEITTRLLTHAESWNHLSAAPHEYSLQSSLSFGEVIARFQSVESFFETHLEPESPLLVGWSALVAWERTAEYWAKLDDCKPSSVLGRLAKTADIKDIPMVAMFIDNGAVPYETKLSQVLTSWFLFQHPPSDQDTYAFCSEAARGTGFPEDIQTLYRSACRESVNHSWSSEAIVALGVLGNNQARLKKFDKNKIGEQLDKFWQHEAR